MNWFSKVFKSVILLLIFFVNILNAENNDYKKRHSLSKTFDFRNSVQFNINNISTWIVNNGSSDLGPLGNSGFVYPKGSNKTAVYESGFVWGAKVNGQKRVGGSTFNHGLKPGAIIDGVREDESLDHVRIYRVRPDWKNGNLNGEVEDSEGTVEEIRDQYEKDWNEWPAIYGAPFDDINENGIYESEIDIPGVVGADQTVWFVSNDLDIETTQGLYGSDPMGIEMQATFWGYNSAGVLGNTMLRKYKLINKSTNTFDSMHVSMWSDPDLGDAGDDLVGCDSSLSLMYVFNGIGNDAVYGDNPPAVGFCFLQGPIIEAEPFEEAIYNGKKKGGFKNLQMTSAIGLIKSWPYGDAPLGDYKGTLQIWNHMRGLDDLGRRIVNPITNTETKFTFSGDPALNTGWLCSQLVSPGDRQLFMSSGDFTMEPGDTQEVILAQIIAGGTEGINNLDAVTLLKQYSANLQAANNNFFQPPSASASPKVKATALDQEIILNWGWNLERVAETENPSIPGFTGYGNYDFQGYNVYQLPSKTATKDEAVKIATLDLIDGIKIIRDGVIDSTTGIISQIPVQIGYDTGINRTMQIDKDYINNKPLYNGSEYYYAVTAYYYNGNIIGFQNNLENTLEIIEVIPESNPPGVIMPEETYNSGLEVVHSEGSANATVSVKVVDPGALTGDDYEIFFDQQHYYMDVDGVWKKTNYADSVGSTLSKIGDVSPSTISGIAFTSPIAGTKDIKFTVNLVSPDFNYAEGVKLTFPPEVQINSAYGFGLASFIDDATNSVLFGNEVLDSTGLTGAGAFSDGELVTVNINTVDLPLSFNYVIYDDGWATLFCSDTANAATCDAYGITDAVVVNAEGITTITEEAFAFHTEQHWNVRNVTQNAVVLEDQLVIKNVNTFTGAYEGPTAAPVVDGLQINIDDGAYAAPRSMLSYTYNGGGSLPFGHGQVSPIDMSDYGIQGWAASGRSIDAFGNGTTEVDQLKIDYEIRVTGEYEDLAADNIYRVKAGTGSMATLYGARGYDIANHPLNPNPGSADPFLLRIPIEVWNVDDNQQVNLLVYHRVGSPDDVPFYSFNPAGRMYCEVNNTPYTPDVVNSGDPANADTDNLTWNWVFWGSDLSTGDVVNVNYANPLQRGKDVFSFTAPLIQFDALEAKKDVKEVNVFPNPYYALLGHGTNSVNNYVTFNHLPERAIIRIFNLAGHRIRKYTKDDETQFLKWDLMNEHNSLVASGLYIVYIDMPELNETKILKLAVITETFTPL